MPLVRPTCTYPFQVMILIPAPLIGHWLHLKKRWYRQEQPKGRSPSICARVLYLNQTIVFTSEDTRSPGEEMIFQAYPKEEVVISGAIPFEDNLGGLPGRY